MNKNQLIIIMIGVLSLIVGMFIYAVFRTVQQDGAQESPKTGSDFEERVNNENLQNDIIKTIEPSDDIKKNDVVKPQIDTVQVRTEMTEAPQTGPGSTSAIIAMIVAVCISSLVYLKTAGKRS